MKKSRAISSPEGILNHVKMVVLIGRINKININTNEGYQQVINRIKVLSN